MNALEEMARLKRLTWSALQREGLDAGVPLGRVQGARTRDELRLLILQARHPQVGAPTRSQGAHQATRGVETPRQSSTSSSQTLTRTSDERTT